VHGTFSGLLQAGILALAYDIPSGNTELFNPEARAAAVMTATAIGYVVGPAIGGCAAAIGGPFFALSFSTVLLAALGILVLLRFPVTQRQIAVPEVGSFLSESSVQKLLPGVCLLGAAMSVLRPIFPVHCNYKVRPGDELSVGLSFSIFYAALHASDPLAFWLLRWHTKGSVVILGIALTALTFPFLLVHDHHLAETGSMAAVGCSVGIAVAPITPWLATLSKQPGATAKLREARLLFDKALNLGVVLGPLLGGTCVSSHGDMLGPIMLLSVALITYAFGVGRSLASEGGTGSGIEDGAIGQMSKTPRNTYGALGSVVDEDMGLLDATMDARLGFEDDHDDIDGVHL